MTTDSTNTPHYHCLVTGDNYCQYCLEGIAERTPDDYLLLDTPRGACVNCAGESTPAETDYYIVPACTIAARADVNAAHAAQTGGYMSYSGERLTAKHLDAQTIRVSGVYGDLDDFNLADWRQMLAEGLRRPHGLRINW